ncbi:transporter substrate-binding domain-containing protein [Labrys monachus]|uniref:Polar amino acid transport system substrate-binding protein n=1 Tax=Labrys monachus TaxID=217067 RepID=A0ABU0F7B3_9HYPH|nr:transporter substrate-binding domain-containing protein [Labrys monachus]MDQ0390499.1 polar amino acid transport system substrate-binding protein [Labrys monachus]
MFGIALRNVVQATLVLAGITVFGSAYAEDCAPKVDGAALLTPGEVSVSINPVSPPMQYADANGDLKGMRVEVGDAILQRLCLKSQHIRVDDFGTMIPGLKSGRWDMINTGVFYTEERAKVIYLVRYENQAISVATRPGEASGIKSVDDLSGKMVGVDIGGYEENKLKALDAELQSRGLAPIKITIFNDTNINYQALKAGQIDASFTIDAVSKEYADRGLSQIALKGLYPAPVAMAFRTRELADAFARTLTQMRDDGSYQAIFEKYGKQGWTGPFDVKGPGI